MIAVAFGRSGSGKTHGLAVELRRHLRERKRQLGRTPLVFVHDLRCYYAGRGSPPGGTTPAGDQAKGRILCRTAGSLVPQGGWFASPEAWRKSGWRGRVVGLHACEAEEVAAVGQRCMAARIPAVLWIDELDRLPPQLQQRSALFSVLQHGRRTPVDVFGSARRPQAIDKGFLSEANVALIFALTERAARVALEGSGWPGAEQWARRLADLKPREHFRVAVGPDIL